MTGVEAILATIAWIWNRDSPRYISESHDVISRVASRLTPSLNSSNIACAEPWEKYNCFTGKANHLKMFTYGPREMEDPGIRGQPTVDAGRHACGLLLFLSPPRAGRRGGCGKSDSCGLGGGCVG